MNAHAGACSDPIGQCGVSVELRIASGNGPHPLGGTFPASMLTVEQFREWLKSRHEGETLAQIGRSLGVPASQVSRWISAQRTPAPTVLILAAHLSRFRSSPHGIPASSDDAGE